jgi:hypothetical protein
MLVTNHFDQYKEATRGVWNTYILCDGRADWDDHEVYQEIDRLLFETTVLKKIGFDRCRKFHGKFKVRSKGGHDCLPVIVNRDGDGGYWDHPVTALINDDYDIDFIEFFDWDQLAHRDNRYVMARIITSSKHPEINGHKALIETQYVDYIYEPSAQQGDAPEPATDAPPA